MQAAGLGQERRRLASARPFRRSQTPSRKSASASAISAVILGSFALACSVSSACRPVRTQSRTASRSRPDGRLSWPKVGPAPGRRRSARRAKMVQLECTALQRLPGGRTTDYDEATVFVTSSSGFVLRTCRRG